MENQRETVRIKIVHEWKKNPQVSYSIIAKICNTSKSNVCKTLLRFKEHNTTKSRPKTGRPKGPSNTKLEKNILKTMKKNRSMSVRDIAKKNHTSNDMIQRVKKRNNLKVYKKQRCPKRSKKQANVALRRSKLLYKHLLTHSPECILMDDETYIKMDFSTLPGPQFYTASPDEVLDHSETSIATEKFGEKILVWQAICQCGLKSTPFFTKGTINTEIYIKECLKKRLLPFKTKHNVSTLFWPDLATSHYAAETIDFMTENGIVFVSKNINPPNTPELRPVERYWARIKALLRKDGRTTKTIEEFKKIYLETQKKIDMAAVQTLMAGIKRKIRMFQRQSLIQ